MAEEFLAKEEQKCQNITFNNGQLSFISCPKPAEYSFPYKCHENTNYCHDCGEEHLKDESIPGRRRTFYRWDKRTQSFSIIESR